MTCRQFTCVALVGMVGFGASWAQTSSTTSPATNAAATPKATADIEKVEKLLAARRNYQLALQELRAHYVASGDEERRKWVEDELRQFHRMNKQAYRLELETPPPTLQPSQNIADANDLYKRAMMYKDKGRGDDYIDNQRRSELLLQQLLNNYPQSNKIDRAAYQLGDLYESKAFKQYKRAAAYFELSFQWHPNTELDARIRAARLYDRVQERTKAIEIYKEVTTYETDPKRLEEARKRLQELSQRK